MKKLMLCLWGMCCALTLNAQKELTIDDIWGNPAFYTQPAPTLQWYDSLTYAMASWATGTPSIDLYHAADGKKKGTLVSATQLTPYKDSFDDFLIAPDKKSVLIKTATVPIYRHSDSATWMVCQLETGKMTPLSPNGKQICPLYSPDGKRVAWCRSNDLYITDLASGRVTRVTTDGKKDYIINGYADWVYEEEFSQVRYFDWSPDGLKIAFLKFDETEVPTYTLQYFNTDGYPENYTYKYPRAGQKNSIVKPFVYDLVSGKTLAYDLGTETDSYIPRLQWTGEKNTFSLIWLNRRQNNLRVYHVTANSGKSRIVFEEKTDKYIELPDGLFYLKDGLSFLTTSEVTETKEVFLVSVYDNYSAAVSFTPAFYMEQLLGYDEANNTFYYITTKNNKDPKNPYDARQRVLVKYRPYFSMVHKKDFVEMNADKDSAVRYEAKNRHVFTLSQGTQDILGADVGVHEVTMNKWFTFYQDSHSTLNTPTTHTLCSTTPGKTPVKLEDNAALVKKLAEYSLPEAKIFSFNNAEGMTLNGWYIKPTTTDAKKKMPVMIYVYGGPGSNVTTNEWMYQNMLWFKMLAQKGIIVVAVDGRGTGGRGVPFKKSTYSRLGELELADLQATVTYLNTLAFVDPTRISVFGWSYGGYMAALAAMNARYIKLCIAVAPVTWWGYYDSIYAERYMGLPSENTDGYRYSQLARLAAGMSSRLLLIHGTADDNVHVQNTYALHNALIRSGGKFDCIYYPDRNHGIYGGKTRLHLYKLMTDYLLNNL